MQMNFTEGNLKDYLLSSVKPEVLSLIITIGNFLTSQGIESYLVGGFIRDMLLGRETADLDIAVSSDALEGASEIAHTIGGKYITLDRINRVGRVVLINHGTNSIRVPYNIDISTITGNIEQDLARRDFTVDALAIEIKQFGKDSSDVRLVDPFNGRNDLRCGIIRVVAETSFSSDAVRLLRAIRLAAELGFKIDVKTEVLIRQYAHLITSVAGERVREELLRLMAVPDSGSILNQLDNLGLLIALFPELAETKEVEQPKEHFWYVFEHSIKTVSAIDFLLRQGTWEYAGKEALDAAPWSAVLAKHFEQEVSSGSNRRVLLKLAALFHDIGKPQTKTIDADGRMRFLGHAKEGAVIVAKILERVRFSIKEIKLIETEVNYHLRPTQMSQEGFPSRRAIYRYFRDTGDTGIDILYLSLADHLATRGPKLDVISFQEHARLVDYIIGQHFEQKNLIHPPKLVDGYDIINIFGIGPGPKIGELLESVREAQASGEVNNRREALAFIREHTD
jgi:poly(A) polymerase